MEQILEKLVSFPTVADDPQAVHQALDYISDFLVTRGMHVARYDHEGKESIVATLTPEHKTPRVLLTAHLDVVPAPEQDFVMRKAEGKLFGRGVLDMKFAIAAYMQFVDDHQAHLQDYDFGIMITSDEELGGLNGVKPLVAEGYLPKVCILPDGGDNWQIQLTSKGFYYLRLVSRGVSAHGSRPWKGNNAIIPLMSALHAIHALFDNEDPAAKTLNIGVISGGEAMNQVAAEASAGVDIRIPAGEDGPAIVKEITDVCTPFDVEVRTELDGSATKFALDDPYIEPFARAITEVTGVNVQGSHTLGSNDCRFFAEHDIPCISLYPTGAGHHGPIEWIDATAFQQFAEVLTRYMNEVSRLNSR